MDGQAGGRGYAGWLRERSARTSAWRTWGLTLAMALAAGPWAVLGVFWGSGRSVLSGVTLVVFGPLCEEVMKVAAPLYVVEKRPYLFRSRLQLMLCALGSGLAFAMIENLLYLRVYIKQPDELLVLWRMTVCVWLHVGCTLISGMGLSRTWRDCQQRQARPRLQLASAYVVTATVIHGCYNGLMLALSAAGFGP